MHGDRDQLSEHVNRLAEAVKLVVDRGSALLVFLLTDWHAEVQTCAPVATLSAAQLEKPMTVKEAAEFYRVKENTIYELVKRREIRFIKIGDSLRIPPIPPVEPLSARPICVPARRRSVVE